MAIHHHEELVPSGLAWDSAHPQPESTLRTYDTQLEDIRDLRCEYNPAPGVAKELTSLVRMSDGSINVLRQLTPAHQKFELRAGLTTPLATRVNGYNTYVGYELARQGMGVDIIGAPQNMQDKEHLSHEAHNFSQIIHALTETQDRTRQVVLGGVSRAAMEAPGIASYLSILGFETPLIIIQDPCLAKALGIVETGKDMTPTYIASELIEGGKGLIERHDDETLLDVGKHIIHLGETVSFSPKYFKTHSKITKEIWKGEAGELVVHTPEEAVLVMHFFKGSRFNHYRYYKEATRHLPNARAVEQEGMHLTMVRKSVTKAYVGQFALGQQMLAEGSSREEIANMLDYPLVNPKPNKHRTRHLKIVG